MLNRRDFMKSTAAAVAAAGRTEAAGSNGMFVALNSALTGNKVQWPEFIQLAAKSGYGGVDLNLNPAMKDGVDATRGVLNGLKLRTSFCSLPVNATGTDELFQRGMSTLEDAAKFVSSVGCGRMMMVLPAGSATPADELRKTLKERLTAVGTVLARQNVRLGLEFLGPLQFRTRAAHAFIWRMNDAVDFAKEIGPNIGVVLDAWHWHHSGATVDDIIRAGKSRIVTIHLSDAAKQAPEDVKDNQRLLPGEGVIEPAERGVEHADKLAQFVGGVRNADALGEIAGGNPGGGDADGLDGAKGAQGNPPVAGQAEGEHAAARGDQEPGETPTGSEFRAHVLAHEDALPPRREFKAFPKSPAPPPAGRAGGALRAGDVCGSRRRAGNLLLVHPPQNEVGGRAIGALKQLPFRPGQSHMIRRQLPASYPAQYGGFDNRRAQFQVVIHTLQLPGALQSPGREAEACQHQGQQETVPELQLPADGVEEPHGMR